MHVILHLTLANDTTWVYRNVGATSQKKEAFTFTGNSIAYFHGSEKPCFRATQGPLSSLTCIVLRPGYEHKHFEMPGFSPYLSERPQRPLLAAVTVGCVRLTSQHLASHFREGDRQRRSSQAAVTQNISINNMGAGGRRTTPGKSKRIIACPSTGTVRLPRQQSNGDVNFIVAAFSTIMKGQTYSSI